MNASACLLVIVMCALPNESKGASMEPKSKNCIAAPEPYTEGFLSDASAHQRGAPTPKYVQKKIDRLHQSIQSALLVPEAGYGELARQWIRSEGGGVHSLELSSALDTIARSCGLH